MGKSTRAKSRSAPDKRTPAQRLADEARERIRAGWARRHPDIARNERALRKARSDTLQRWKHKNDGTPETHEHARHQQGALARLYATGAIDAEQLASAVEIATVAERIGRDVAVKTASLETRIDRAGWRHETIHDEKLGQVRREMAYTRWRAMLREPAAVLDMIVGDCGEFFDCGPIHANRGPLGFTVAAARHHIGARRAKRLLIDALDLWPRVLADIFRHVDERDLAWAHTRVMA